MPGSMDACELENMISQNMRGIETDQYQGTRDITYSVANAQEEIKLFKNSPDAKVVPVEGGHHFLSSSSPEEVASNLLEFVKKYSNLKSQS